MTTSTGRGTRTEAELLYLRVDLGERPSLDVYGRSTAALLTLARYATFLVSGDEDAGDLPPSSVHVVRTSLASPWVTVLTDLAKTSSPVGYGAAALFALHRLLQMVMTWQRHRLDIAERDLQLKHLRDALEQESRHLKDKFFNISPEAQTDLGRSPGRAAEMSRLVQSALGKLGPLSEVPHSDDAMRAAQDLGQIDEVQMISRDDPRASGSSDT